MSSRQMRKFAEIRREFREQFLSPVCCLKPVLDGLDDDWSFDTIRPTLEFSVTMPLLHAAAPLAVQSGNVIFIHSDRGTGSGLQGTTYVRLDHGDPGGASALSRTIRDPG
jgi:hypothetical protein